MKEDWKLLGGVCLVILVLWGPVFVKTFVESR